MAIVVERENSAQGSVNGICSSAGSPGKRTLAHKYMYINRISRGQ